MTTIKQQVAAVSVNLAGIVAAWADEPDVPPVVGVEKDPRSARAKAFNNGSGKIDGMKLVYHQMPGTRFQLVDFDLFTEDESKGGTNTVVHVYKWANVGGQEVLIPARVRCYLAWPIGSDGNPDGFEEKLVPGNVSEPYDHVTQSTFTPPKVGPLAIFIGNDQGEIDSDIGGGIGLPNNRHVCFHLVFVERKTA